MVAFEFKDIFAQPAISGPVFLDVSSDRLISVSGQTGKVLSFELLDNSIPISIETNEGESEYPFPSNGQVLDDGTIWLWNHLHGRTWVTDDERVIQLDGGPIALTAVAQLSLNHFVIGVHDKAQLMLISGSDVEYSSQAVFADDAKTTVADLSDMLAVTIADQEFLVAASHSESGLTSFRVDNHGFEVIDTIGTKDGLWVSGINRLGTSKVEGESFVIALSSGANSLVTLRMNELGVFFVADQVWDTKETRFAGAVDIDTFEWNDRSFVVAGGQDQGLSLFEVLPEGTLFYHASIAQTSAWDVGAITEIETVNVGQQAQIFVTGVQGAGIAQLTVDLSRTGDRIIGDDRDNNLSGGWKDDVLIGDAGDDHIFGKAGDDVLVDGKGSDVLVGENGADVFVFVSDGEKDKIKDYELGEDRIHIGGWGRIYDYSSLDIATTSWGARISWADETLDVFSKGGHPIEIESWDAADFIF